MKIKIITQDKLAAGDCKTAKVGKFTFGATEVDGAYVSFNYCKGNPTGSCNTNAMDRTKCDKVGILRGPSVLINQKPGK